ncbi:hypothetical protein VYF65_002995 [Lysinibacillus irui]|uniref:hypothetical protein n=1 Tax=Lysinibacillus irui TaxID=2998077 RepID=UPI003889062D
MAFIYRYELKNKNNRQKINLQLHEENIVDAIDQTFGDNVLSIKVFFDFFEFRLQHSIATNLELQTLGKKIVSSNPELNSYKKIYKKNSQLFRRKKSSYYAFLEDIEYENQIYYLKFDLVDQEDSDRIQNEFEENQTPKGDLLSTLNTFSMIVEIKELDLMEKKIKNILNINNDEATNRWYLLKGKHVKSGNSLIFLDYTESQDIVSNFMLFSIDDLEETKSAQLEKFYSLEGIEHLEIADFNENYDDFFIAVYNVGQGLCSAICNYNSQPIVYFDFGGGERRDAVTYPSNGIEYCFSLKPKIILSHWHRDHWIGVHYCEEALKTEWIVPNQKKGPQVIKLCGDISKNGKLTELSSGTLKTPFGSLFIGNGDNSHYHNNGIGLLVENKSNERFLLPGDNRYQFIPDQFLSNLNGLVASHHGGKYFKNNSGENKIPSNVNEGKIVYSYGKHEKFNPKFNSHGHPSYNDEYINYNWVESLELHTPDGHCAVGNNKKINKCNCGCDLEIECW